MGLRGLLSIKILIQLMVAVILLVSFMVTGYFLYEEKVRENEQHIEEISTVALAPIVTLANASVAGGNIMRLKNQDAQSLYRTTKALYISIKGMSDSKEIFGKKQPSKAIAYTYTGDTKAAHPLSAEAATSLLQSVPPHQEMSFTPDRAYLIITKKLNVANGGEVQAVFDSSRLGSLRVDTIMTLLKILIPIMIVFQVLAFFMSRKILESLIETQKTVDAMAKNRDLTTTIETVNIAEINAINKSFNNLVEGMRGLILDAKSISGSTQQQSNNLVDISEKTLQEIQTQDKLIATTYSDLVTINETIATLCDDTREGIHAIATTKQSVEDFSSQLEQMSAHIMHNLETETELSERIHQVSVETAQVKLVLDVIKDIADQTNLLALNAAIEAARAGEHGRGFAVVADEVRQLAEKTQKSLNDIESTVNVIVQSISNVSDDMKRNSERLPELANTIETSKTSMQQISGLMNNLRDDAQKVSDINTAISVSISTLQSNMDQVHKISQVNEQMTAQVAHSAKDLKSSVAMLDKNIETFRI
ncbi:MAG: hypothetical protein DSZ03_03365 [Sulfurimonas sp.]|nr:MAG: hypothetical protein DSZ03_03365 [Sulfurimonas sp.]